MDKYSAVVKKIASKEGITFDDITIVPPYVSVQVGNKNIPFDKHIIYCRDQYDYGYLLEPGYASLFIKDSKDKYILSLEAQIAALKEEVLDLQLNIRLLESESLEGDT